jgi:UDP-N-acetylglucosamine diphosphorylase/glucosamine-1-phosphate N-acetyltransferase
MAQVVFFDTEARDALLPFTYTRPIAECKVGYLSLAEKWEFYLGNFTKNYITSPSLAHHFVPAEAVEECLYISGDLIPSNELAQAILGLEFAQGLVFQDKIIALRYSLMQDIPAEKSAIQGVDWQDNLTFEVRFLSQLVDFQNFLPTEILRDIEILKDSLRICQDHPRIHRTGDAPIYRAENAKIGHCYINTENGPVVIAEHAEIMDGAMIRGPVIIGKSSLVKMGAKIYENTAIGDQCKVAGEIQSSLLFGNCNKGHEGYLGNSVLGEWCNLGADTNNSNLKNNYEEVKLWSYAKNSFVRTGRQFCGLFMGDHSKCAINTMFNTGTVVGVSANIFGSGFPRNFIPSFTWGGSQSLGTYQLPKAIETAQRVFARRGKDFTEQDSQLMEDIFNESKKYRSWEK